MLHSNSDLIESIQISNLVPVIRELPADLETPVSVYLKLSGAKPSFLLESVTGGEQLARYSFIGVNPRKKYVLHRQKIEVHEKNDIQSIVIAESGDPFDILRSELERFRMEPIPGLPRFIGGLVGYLGYEAAAFFESNVPIDSTDTPDLPIGVFLLADTVVAFDHAFGRMLLIAVAEDQNNEEFSIREAEIRLDALESAIKAPLLTRNKNNDMGDSNQLLSNISRADFIESVKQAKEYIAAGDIFQVVLSQRLSRRTSAAPFDIYRELRRLNPSPYMFYIDFGQLFTDEPFSLIGASPEMHVRLSEGVATLRPIAGTRRRGGTPAEDDHQAQDLLADEKERAEHVMLVDLARNDLGRVCEYGSVQVEDLMVVERYSHVMHIVSQVVGKLRAEFDAFDLLRATFPAGTVSGAPKIRAMQILSELESGRRGPYAGVVGYISLDGSMDTCITIRTLVMEGSEISVQAGAGIVADSDPESEYQETLSKAKALAVAVDNAEAVSLDNRRRQ